MFIARNTLFSRLTKATVEEREWLAEYLTYESDKKVATGAFGKVKKYEAPRIRLFNMLSNAYPAGFDSLVEKAAKAAGHSINFVDARVPPCAPYPDADLGWLRDYQPGAVKAITERKRGILWLPTGAGKTEVAVGLTRALPCQWLALVHRSQLADDIATRFEKRSPGLFAGRVLEGRWEVPDDASLICATYPSIGSALKRAGTHGPKDETYLRIKNLLTEWAQGLLVDEVHTVSADTFYKIAMQTRRAYFRVGLSGTPLQRSDKKDMYTIAAIGPVVYRVRSQLLIKRGVLAKPTVRLLTCDQQSGAATWHGVESQLIIKSPKRNARLIEACKRAAQPGLLFVNKVEHGKALTKMLISAGIPAEFVWGNHSVAYRKSLIKRLEQGHFGMLVCSTVFNEGIDIPALRSVVVGAGGKSLIAVFQRMGRGMRIDRDGAGAVKEGGGEFEVWDILDTGNKWTARHASMRQGAYASEEYQTFVEPDVAAPRKVRKSIDTIRRMAT